MSSSCAGRVPVQPHLAKLHVFHLQAYVELSGAGCALGGRDAPDVDPLVFLGEAPPGLPPLEAGQLRRCLVTGSSLFDLEAHPVA